MDECLCGNPITDFVQSAGKAMTLRPRPTATIAARLSAPRAAPWMIVTPCGSFSSLDLTLALSAQNLSPQTRTFAIFTDDDFYKSGRWSGLLRNRYIGR